MATNKKNELDTTYATNLRNNQGSIPTAQQTAQGASINNNQNSNVNIDTSYQANSGALYGGHTASWWQQQYGSADNDSKEMIKKAADYYGYQIPEAVSQSGTPIPSNNQVSAAATNLNYSANVKSLSTPAEQTTTGQTNTTVNQETTDIPIDSYEEFLQKQAEGYQETLDKTNQYIDEQKQSTIERAEAERERNIVDARSSYAQNRAGYGTNAETLASMGLTGSGYSDYLDQQAYATQRAEVQTANTQAESTKLNAEQQASADKLNAQLTYDQNMAQNEANLADYQLQQEEQRKAAYAELLTYANNGTYTAEQLSELGKQYGLTDEQVEALTSTSQENSYKNYLEEVTNGYVDTDVVDDAYENGEISTEQYNIIKDKWNSAIDTTESFFVYNGETLDEESAKKALETVINNKWCSTETKEALQTTFDNIYETAKILSGKKYFNYNGSEYKIKEVLKDNANQIKRNNDFKDKLKSLGFTNPFDDKIPNGTTIKSNVDNKGSNDFNWWDDVGAFFLSPFGAGAWDSWGNWNEIYMTYYDGHWYLSEKV